MMNGIKLSSDQPFEDEGALKFSVYPTTSDK